LNRGGAEMMTLDVCRNANAHGLDLTFLASGGGDLENDFRHSGVDYIRLNRKRPLDRRLIHQIRQIIKQRDIQVVHSHQPVEALHLHFATRRLETRHVLTLHGFNQGTKNELALKFVLPRTDGSIVVSNDLRNSLANVAGFRRSKNLTMIENGVDEKRLQAPDHSLWSELQIPAESFLMGMIANFTPAAAKDQLTICKALPRVFAALPQAHFLFVGGRSAEGPNLFEDCVRFCREAGIGKRVHFLGKRSDIAEVLSCLDIFVLSSQREGSPIAVIEAMMKGIPTVLSDIRALRELSRNGDFACLFRTGDNEDLAEKLIGFARKQEERTVLARKAQQWALQNFNISRHISNLISFYSSMIVPKACELQARMAAGSHRPYLN